MRLRTLLSQCILPIWLHSSRATPLEYRAASSQLFSNLFVFGDSYSTLHFSVSGTQPNASNPIGNPAFPGSTTSGGPNWVSDVTAVDNSSLVLSYDFAVAGATVDDDLVMAYLTTVPSFVQQVAEFEKYYDLSTGVYTSASAPSVQWSSNDTLFAAFFGINDIVNGYVFPNWTTTRPQVVDQYFAQAALLHSYGATNFVFFTIPPLWKTPKYVATNATAQAAIQNEVCLFNDLLHHGLKQFRSEYPGSKVWLLDTQPIFDKALDDPSAYGAADATCYNSNGLTCLWWNDFHPGQAIHGLVAQAVSELTGI
ncbi:carbohydrate esterase family 16 protein [Xylariales sp. PMI_506]|nr:carbohydrate esterase family 16 protein [Xylariales sp. PMI_506]